MVGTMTAASGIGAGVSQGRIQSAYSAPRVKDQPRLPEDVRTAALQLIQKVVATSDAAIHDLDLLA